MSPRADVQDDREAETLEVELLSQGIFRRWGFDLRDSDPAWLGRLARARVRAEGLRGVSGLLERVLRDRAVLERLLAEAAGGGDDGLFRPPAFWRALRRKVVPYLRTYPSVRLWQVGAAPAELYSLCILLREGLPRNVRVYATGLFDGLVDRARSGKVPASAVASAGTDYRRSGGRGRLARWFESGNGSSLLAEDARRPLVFASHNAATDAGFQHFHAILARGALAPFSGSLRDRTLRLLHDSLLPLGFLALRPRESLRGTPLDGRYEAVDRAAGILQKVKA